MEKTWKDAIKRVLKETDGPLHYAEISERILTLGYYATDGATPAATVNAQIATSIKHDGEKSPFIRVGRGLFTLRSAPLRPVKRSNKAKTQPSEPNAEAEDIGSADEESLNSIIHSFGMYWQRDLVVWRHDLKMYGKQQAQAKPVDFGKQKGIYILYDHHTVVYVGRAIDRPLGKRLYEHTTDRLSSRWNRFSWFGLLGVSQEGNLREAPYRATLATLVSTLEALLIEALEPPQNRRRGDDFSSTEFFQDIDPELKEREIQNTLHAIEQKLRGSI